MFLRVSTFLGLLLVCTAAPVFGQIHVYNGESIQDAITSASSGQTVLVHNGLYQPDPEDFGKISFQGKNITLISEHGPDSTTIFNAQIELTGGQSRSARIEGFKLKATGMVWQFKIFLDSASSATIVNCRFDGPYSTGVGAYNGSTPLVQNCEFIKCGHYDTYGGGVLSYNGSNVDVENCYFERCLGWGGALFADYSATLTADLCTFVYCGDADPGNPDPLTKSGVAGAAGVNHGSTLNLNDCTIFGSYADWGGAAIDATDGTVNLDNCIVAFSGDPASGGATFDCRTGGNIVLSCCDVYGNAAGDFTGCVSGQGVVRNNFSADPLFCDTAAHDVGLMAGSPCISAGTCGQVGSIGETCTGGQPICWHISPTGSDVTGDGTPGNPWKTIQYAINQSSDGQCITAHPGTYDGPGNRFIDYNGRNVTLQSEWGPDSTIIDCDTTRGFIFDSHEDTTFVLRGFTIREGSEEAILCDRGGSPLIEDCIFLENIRGISCKDSASPVIRRCEFRDNYMPDGWLGGGIGVGAAIYCGVGIDTSGIDTLRRSNPTIDSCVFEGNRANHGSAIYCYQSRPVIKRSLFLRNGFDDTTGVAAGIWVGDGPGPIVEQCTFYGNIAATGSAVGVQLSASLTLDRCLMVGNVVRLATGRVVLCDHSAYVNMNDCNVYGNNFGDYLGCIETMEGVDGNFSADPIFCDAASDHFGLRGHSPCVPNHPFNESGDFIGAFEVDCEGPVWIVAPWGDDVTGDGTFAAPWASFAHAMDTTPAGDTLMATAGEFTGADNRFLSLDGKELTISSFYGADSTTINLNNHSTGFTFDHNEDSTSTINGITFRGASVHAIRCDSAAPSISECTFMFNTTAIDIRDGSDPHITDCKFIDNIDLPGDVSGISIRFSSPLVERCYFEGNRTFSGGAVRVAGFPSTPTFSYCQFIRNGIPLYQTSHGAGLAAYMNAHPVVDHCTFFGNMADWGSALYLQDAYIDVSNSLVAYNFDGWTGHPVYCLNSGNIDLSCTNVFGNEGGDYHSCVGDEWLQDGNISVNPLFCDTAAGDFHLASNSLCLAAHNGCGVLMGALDSACAALSNTPVGTDVPVTPEQGVDITFEEVTGEGQTDVTQQTGGPTPPGALATMPSDPTTYYNITTTATHTGDIEICVTYDEDDLDCAEWELKLQHYDDTGWVDITSSHDRFNNIICGVTIDLSPFAIIQDTAGNAPPTAHQRLLPVDSSTVTPGAVDFVWSSCVDPDGDTVTYILHVTVGSVDTTFEIADTTQTLHSDSLGLPGGRHDVNWTLLVTDGVDTTAAANDPGIFTLDLGTAVAADEPVLPTEYALGQNYPNPFNAGTAIRFELPEAADVELSIYNLLGQRVITLASGSFEAGFHQVVWDGRDALGRSAASGVYFCRMRASAYVSVRKMLYVK